MTALNLIMLLVLAPFFVLGLIALVLIVAIAKLFNMMDLK